MKQKIKTKTSAQIIERTNFKTKNAQFELNTHFKTTFTLEAKNQDRSALETFLIQQITHHFQRAIMSSTYVVAAQVPLSTYFVAAHAPHIRIGSTGATGKGELI